MALFELLAADEQLTSFSKVIFHDPRNDIAREDIDELVHNVEDIVNSESDVDIATSINPEVHTALVADRTTFISSYNRINIVRNEWPMTFKTKHMWNKHNPACDPAERSVVYPSVCDICGKTLRDEGTLKSHIRQDHTAWKPRRCEEPGCELEAAFQTRSSYRDHRKLEHSACSPRPCSICKTGKIYQTRTIFVGHIKLNHKDLSEEDSAKIQKRQHQKTQESS
ncbi:hypothetical protein AJ80_06430 [Polytolypa hystricis UAMH7299]|uniref:C2H2-type domain-containing protein n=1 Tax=Polytolypa hystricis (strain UAMH7299) TaxID=1447883 RepID=A0A2B7XN32_POLH7|nr:hypothetical protein AJ80_06430 [Polytolypa hystricis UAMH7299]